MARSGKNQKCSCGSGMKYEDCCGSRANLTTGSQSFGPTMERQLRSIQKLISDQEFESDEDLNAFLRNAVSGAGTIPGPTTPSEEAQELIFQAWEAPNRRQQERLVKKALELYPDCADAYVFMAEHAPGPRPALEHYLNAVAAGERALGPEVFRPEVFREEVGRFWGLVDTRPYMRARLGLAQCLRAVGAHGPAVAHLREMLRLNPMDNQGVRYELLGCLLELGDLDSVQALLDEFPDEISATWLFSKALVQFLMQGDTSQARDLLIDAMAGNPFVADYLLGKNKLPRTRPSYIGLGDPNEAVHYVSEFGSGWLNSPRALAWLESIRERPSPVPESPEESADSDDAIDPFLAGINDEFFPDLDPMMEVAEREYLPPSLREWDRLYQAAIAFKQAEPWRWMDDRDVFAVEDPTSLEVGYCTVLGSGGREFGLGVFVGDAGYDSYRRLETGEVDPESFEAAAMMRSLSVSFASRQDLDRADYEIIRSLGLRFRGRSAWPLFRSMQPGWLPWYLDRDEARMLGIALEQALEVLARVKDRDDALANYVDPESVLTRFQKRGRWREEWRTPGQPESESQLNDLTDLSRIDQLRKRAGKPSGTWEVDVFAVPEAIPAPSGRLYCPHLCLAVDRTSGMVIGFNLTGPAVDGPSRRMAAVGLFESLGKLPKQMRVPTEAMRQAMEPLASALGISLRVGVLPSLVEAKDSLMDMLLSADDPF